MKVNIEKHFDTVIEVNTTYVASEAGHPRVYYKIKPEIGPVAFSKDSKPSLSFLT